MVALSNCMVIGDRRKYLAMVITLKTEMDLETGLSTDKLAADSLFVGKQVMHSHSLTLISHYYMTSHPLPRITPHCTLT